jgi:hypothetical protein
LAEKVKVLGSGRSLEEILGGDKEGQKRRALEHAMASRIGGDTAAPKN